VAVSAPPLAIYGENKGLSLSKFPYLLQPCCNSN